MKILFREEDIHVNSAVVIKVSGILFLKRRRGLSNAVHTFMVRTLAILVVVKE